MSERPDQQSTTNVNYECDEETSCEETLCETKRRRLLGSLAAGGSLALAGCTGILASPEIEGARGSDESYDVNFLREEQKIEIRGNQTVLRAAEEHGIDVPYQCRAGFCGVCLSQADGDASELVSMAVNDVDDLNEDAIAAGYFLPCTSQPRDDFAITTEAGLGELAEFQEEDEEEEDEDDEENGEDEDVGARHAIEYTNEGWIIPVGENQDLLRAAEDVGLDELPYSCRVGSCGQCLSKIEDGDATELVEHETIDYGPLDEEALAEGYLLTCTAQPRDSFSFESNRAGEL